MLTNLAIKTGHLLIDNGNLLTRKAHTFARNTNPDTEANLAKECAFSHAGQNARKRVCL